MIYSFDIYKLTLHCKEDASLFLIHLLVCLSIYSLYQKGLMEFFHSVDCNPLLSLFIQSLTLFQIVNSLSLFLTLWHKKISRTFMSFSCSMLGISLSFKEPQYLPEDLCLRYAHCQGQLTASRPLIRNMQEIQAVQKIHTHTHTHIHPLIIISL